MYPVSSVTASLALMFGKHRSATASRNCIDTPAERAVAGVAPTRTKEGISDILFGLNSEGARDSHHSRPVQPDTERAQRNPETCAAAAIIRPASTVRTVMPCIKPDATGSLLGDVLPHLNLPESIKVRRRIASMCAANQPCQNRPTLNLEDRRPSRRRPIYIGTTQQSAPPSYLAATASRLAADDDAGELTQLVYLEIQVPRAMHDAVVRHHANLITLSDTLRSAGMPDAVIFAHVDSAIASYRDALVASLGSKKAMSIAT